VGRDSHLDGVLAEDGHQRPTRVEHSPHVASVQALGEVEDLEFHLLPLGRLPVARVGLRHAEMTGDILTAFVSREEAEAPLLIEPADRTRHHLDVLV